MDLVNIANQSTHASKISWKEARTKRHHRRLTRSLLDALLRHLTNLHWNWLILNSLTILINRQKSNRYYRIRTPKPSLTKIFFWKRTNKLMTKTPMTTNGGLEHTQTARVVSPTVMRRRWSWEAHSSIWTTKHLKLMPLREPQNQANSKPIALPVHAIWVLRTTKRSGMASRSSAQILLSSWWAIKGLKRVTSLSCPNQFMDQETEPTGIGMISLSPEIKKKWR